ncbi:nucleoside hydrolase [Clostridium hydrogeniformans]|uniref:nucleoside hydrolase n=1 Tax=Clostridium hydrogeniformans TaxID=349933 RepID=UPI0006901E3C|nr:nucleoside hydrolase [Clostridium hydrogeniformans]
MKSIIIDCDPGLDDVVALFLALAKEDKVKVEAITTVGGNHILDNVTRNTLSVLALIKKKIRVAKGAEGPIMRDLTIASEVHGKSGLSGPKYIPEPLYKEDDKSAVEVMREILEASKEKISIVATGPLTNVAMFLKTYPRLREKIQVISLMGGCSKGGNVTPCAEFNIYVDPEAAHIVFNSGVPIVMSGLDVTHKAQIMREEIEEYKDKGVVHNFFAEMIGFYIETSNALGFEGCTLHDPCAVAYLLNPELFKGKDALVQVETKGDLTRGMTVVNFKSKTPNTKVLMDIDREKFMELIKEAIETLEDRIK